LVPTYTVNVVSAYANVTPAAASYPYEEGTQATFTALDLTEGGIRHVVTGWSTTGAVTQSGTGNTATIPVTGDFTFTWNWKTQYRLQTAVSGPGSVTGGGEQWIDDGASASITATPGSGANFTGWSGDTALGSASGNVFNIASMTRAVSPLTANFMTGFHTLTVVSTQANTVPAPGTYSMAHGTTINYSATTIDNGRARYVPAGWTLSGTPETNGTTPKGSFVLNADTTLSWSWGSEVVLELASGVQGSILPSNAAGWHTLGENVTLQAVPGPKFQFSAWKGDVTGNPNLPTTTIKMSVARTIAADFTAVKAPSGTPQWWLERHAHVNGGDLTAAEQADFDGDGKTAGEEFIAGMDDLDPQKVYKVTGFKLLQGATPKMELSWPAAAGRTYAIWSSPNLQPPFTLVQDNIPSVEPVTTTQVPVGAGLNRLFFKVEAKLIPGGSMDTNPPATKPEPKPGCLLREMKLIPAGEFIMGDDAGGEASSQPAHSVTVAAFFMDKFEVTLGDWKTVATWANANGYDLTVDLHVGDNPPPPLDHPAPGVSWYEAVKWCNARSEMEGRLPAYYTDTQTTTVYRTGTLDLTSANVNWAGNGYRLPTESEWEKACRGGLAGKTYSWGNETQTNRANGWLFQLAIDHTQAPYPLSTPVGYFNGSQVVPGGGPDMANGYGLYDMSGNAWEWCWDRFGDYDKPALFDPKGPDTGDRRLSRGGSWWNNETDLTNAHRYPFPPVGENVYGQIGFRAIRSAGPNEAP
jgi:formylglycine-generating enzyme required for sulfatase activity